LLGPVGSKVEYCARRVQNGGLSNDQVIDLISFDAATGLYKIGERYYDPAVGRWTEEDDVRGCGSKPQTANLYIYANDDPTNEVDPDGRAVWYYRHKPGKPGHVRWSWNRFITGCAGLGLAVGNPFVGPIGTGLVRAGLIRLGLAAISIWSYLILVGSACIIGGVAANLVPTPVPNSYSGRSRHWNQML
jgi:RHS repeat-associated protein